MEPVAGREVVEIWRDRLGGRDTQGPGSNPRCRTRASTGSTEKVLRKKLVNQILLLCLRWRVQCLAAAILWRAVDQVHILD